MLHIANYVRTGLCSLLTCIPVLIDCNANKNVLYKYKPHYSAIYHIVQNERAMADTHYCLYHGTSKCNFIDLLANTYLDHFINGTPLTNDFIKLRADADLYHGNEDLAQYLRNYNDDTCLLFTNLSFPGHTFGGESTFTYFKNDMSQASNVIHRILPHYPSAHIAYDEILACVQEAYRSINPYQCGVVLQVCILHGYIDQYAYLSEPLGIPKTLTMPQAEVSLSLPCFPYMSRILEMYRHDMEQLERYADPQELLACVWLHTSLFSQPGYIQMYAYHTFPDGIYTWLYNELSHILTKHGVIT